MAKLVYVGFKGSTYPDRVEKLCIQHKLTFRTDICEMEDLRAIKANDVLVVTEPRLMRGFDYRSEDKNGIALMMCYDVGTLRDYIQALGRVGRFDDPCMRYTLSGAAMVDKTKQTALDSSLAFQRQ